MSKHFKCAIGTGEPI